MNCFTVAGRHHNFDDHHNQDAIRYKQNRDYDVMVLADGVSSCCRAKEGAEITSNIIANFLLEHGGCFFSMTRQEVVDCILSQIRLALEHAARREGLAAEDYSSTLACILFDRRNERMLYCSIGDSLILAAKDDRCAVIAMPADSRDGCCVTTSAAAESMAAIGVVKTTELRSVMICSDGAWQLMYDRNRLQQPIRSLLLNQDYEQLKTVLMERERFDDCSFISMNFQNHDQRRQS